MIVPEEALGFDVLAGELANSFLGASTPMNIQFFGHTHKEPAPLSLLRPVLVEFQSAVAGTGHYCLWGQGGYRVAGKDGLWLLDAEPAGRVRLL